MSERWLLTGGSGQVGLALRRNPPQGVEIIAPDRGALDLSQPISTGSLPQGISAIINCGAYTAVDRAESEVELAGRINAAAPRDLAAVAKLAGIPIIQVSTDYVFSAQQQGPWREDARTAPSNVYGKTKLAGEQAVEASGARHAIVRTAWVVSADGHNFIKTMLRLGSERDHLRVVSDQHGSPTSAGDLAAALAQITQRFTADPQQESGIWHCSNSGETTWYGLAQHAFACAVRHGLPVPERVEPIASADYPTPAVRPSDSRLDCTRLAKDFGMTLRPWQEAVEDIVAQLAKGRQPT